MALSLDLNFPPVEGTSGAMNSQVASAESNKGLFGYPIDVEAIDDDDDDEIKMLPSSAAFPQRRNRSRKNRRLTVDLEALVEIPPAQSGGSVAEPAAILLSLSYPGASERILTNRNGVNHQLYVDLEVINSNKMKHAKSPTSAPPPKEPTFNCPLCFDSLKSPCSTFCGHIFCQSCIEKCIANSVKERKGRFCPSCRAKLPAKKSFHRVYLPNAD